MTEALISAAPNSFLRAELGWTPWAAPLPEAEFTERHWAGLVDRGRAKSPYFALLARDPEVLGARTRADKDIFYNTEGGASRAEREWAATAASRVNGCIFCASVHSRFFTQHSKAPEAVDKLLEAGVSARVSPRLDAVTDAVAALTRTPSGFDAARLAALRAEGFEDAEILDLIYAGAFFNWANRLMLSLGEPLPPAGG